MYCDGWPLQYVFSLPSPKEAIEMYSIQQLEFPSEKRKMATPGDSAMDVSRREELH